MTSQMNDMPSPDRASLNGRDEGLLTGWHRAMTSGNGLTVLSKATLHLVSSTILPRNPPRESGDDVRMGSVMVIAPTS